MSRLTVVVPTRGNPLLSRALAAVDGHPVVVVDDADSPLGLAVPTLRLGGAGFARACNAGLATVRTPWALLLNDDAAPLDDCIEQLLAAGPVAGPILVGPRGVETEGIEVSRWGRVRAGPGIRRVDAVSGACMLLPASARLDERFRHGFEDVELCRRLGGARVVPTARCWHEGGGTLSRRSAEAQRHAVSGQLRLYDRSWQHAVVVGLHVGQVVRERGPWGRLAGIAEGVRDYWRG